MSSASSCNDLNMAANPDEKTAIRIRDLFVDYGKRHILKGINLDIPTGKITVIMGGSGAGKSTLLRCILGLKKPVSGSIHMLDKDVVTASQKEIYELRKEMGVAFQGGALFSSMSVAENIQLPLHEHTKLDQHTIEIMTRIKLDMVNMLEAEKLMPAELSGGMTKRAALARAIIMDPKLLFFDEPSAGLDPSTAAELDDLILKMKGSLRMTIVVVTHELESIFKIADYIAVMSEGLLIAAGTPTEIRASEHPVVQDYLNRKPREGIVDADAHLRALTEGTD
jgi:phospholipid/cholesterol/gamma-HCH transport system ATP-binding protein